MARTPNDRPFPAGIPKGFRGEKQVDGTVTTHFTAPVRNAPLQDREAAPPRAGESGIERSMRDLADREHR